MRTTILLLFFFCFVSTAFAQLDPNVYRPHIGVKAEFDTIYGFANDQGLGLMVKNLPDPLDETKRRMLAYGFTYQNGSTDQLYPHVFDVTPPINLHTVSPTLFHVGLPNDQRYIFPGHFRSTKYLDLVYIKSSAVIYWADDNGNYDSSRKSYLGLRAINDSQKMDGMAGLVPYIGKFTSDSLDDIVIGCVSTYVPAHFGIDTLYAGIFLAGSTALQSQSKVIYADSIAPIDWFNTVGGDEMPWRGFPGDYRGTGTNDYIRTDTPGNLYYYKFKSPFSITQFAKSLREDTLYARWENPSALGLYGTNPLFHGHSGEPMAIKAFPKVAGDKSIDFIVPFYRSDEKQTSFHFWRGGPDFGTKRLRADNADFQLYDPAQYDGFTFGPFSWPDGYFDCGDMTGTGNHVLGILAAAPPAGTDGVMLFYTLGTALDDKADILVGWSNDGEPYCMDTLDANGDGLEDVMIGMPGWTSDKDAQKDYRSVGAVGILYGSKKIPVHNTAVPVIANDDRIGVFPNPAGRQITIELPTPENRHLQVVLHDVLGREVFRTGSSMLENARMLIDLPELSTAIYYLQIEGLRTPVKPMTILVTGK
ncbi:MAG TPA: T9SS type A sorting domain-containing protein [Candidatus Kapabacteria bacterium]|nr:T9SS type A sorting domain-containing protein [Candidatus Kapabacteria bacterium]